MRFSPLLLASLLSASGAPGTIDLHLIGDSTMADRANANVNPEHGWGQLLPEFVDERVVVHNHAVNGRSTKSFIDEGKWAAVLKQLKPGDYVFIQFGHNDEKIEDSMRYADPHGAYKRNLERFVNESRARGATPVLFTPIVRRKFNTEGVLEETHGEYPAVVRDVAKALNVPFVDLGILTRNLVQPLGPDSSKMLYVYTAKGEYAMYADGREDDTHLSARGATEVAHLAASAVGRLNLGLSAHFTAGPIAIPLRGGDTATTITPYLPPANVPAKSAVLIFPGGGYDHLATEKEGNAVARWLTTVGVASFVVRYRVAPNRYPIEIQDGQEAMRYVRANAAKWHIDPARVGVVGFSAGGHLASTLGTHFDGDTRPAFMMLIYPVITMDTAFAHRSSRRSLLGDGPSPELVRSLSNETQVTPDTPPSFIVATTDDASVPVRNSQAFYDALRAAGVPAELHVFEHGRHGFGLGASEPSVASWTSLAEQWLTRHDWATPPKKP